MVVSDASNAREIGQDDADPGRVQRTLYLIGRPPLKEFLRYVRHHTVTPPPEGTLIDQWQAARALVHQMKTSEAGLADHPPITKLGPEYEPLLIEFLKDPLVRHGFNSVPTEVAIIELDRLVVYQKHIDVTHAGRLEQRHGAALSWQEIFSICLPFDHPSPPVKWARVHSGKYVFVSPSNDLRFLSAMQLEASQLTGIAAPGALVGVIGLAVGFGSNFMNAVYAENRLILNNGSHRAYALRRMGITHVPCIVQHVSSRDELAVVASSDVRNHADFYLTHPRPPMLRDYFHPGLHAVMDVHARVRQVTIRFEIEEDYRPAL